MKYCEASLPYPQSLHTATQSHALCDCRCLGRPPYRGIALRRRILPYACPFFSRDDCWRIRGQRPRFFLLLSNVLYHVRCRRSLPTWPASPRRRDRSPQRLRSNLLVGFVHLSVNGEILWPTSPARSLSRVIIAAGRPSQVGSVDFDELLRGIACARLLAKGRERRAWSAECLDS